MICDGSADARNRVSTLIEKAEIHWDNSQFHKKKNVKKWLNQAEGRLAEIARHSRT
jgi:hypothetical protein